jgi:predicted PurR-regulated permease PerM
MFRLGAVGGFEKVHVGSRRLGTGWLIYLLAPILMSLVAGVLAANLSDPLADRLEALGLKRQNAVIVVFAAIVFAIGFVLLLIIPMLEE